MPAAGLVVKSISEQVADQLRQAVLVGEFPPGTPLREDDLAERYGVSRHPIRKVLQQLTLEGLLVSRPNCGVSVAADATEHVHELLTPLRVQLEVYALRRATPAELRACRGPWERIVRHMARAADDQDEQAILSLDAEFHQQLLKAAGMDDFVPLWLAIFGRMRGHHRMGNRTLEHLGMVSFIHQRLVQSLLGPSRDAAAADLASHLQNTEFNHKSRAAWKRQRRHGGQP